MFWTEGGAVELRFVCGGMTGRGSAFWRKEKVACGGTVEQFIGL